jgi:hypothetical protein
MKALFLTVLLATACTKYSPVTKDAMGLRVSDVSVNISHLTEIEWPVGKKKEIILSQSFSFLVEMPRIRENDLEHITNTKGVNAWIIRMIVQRGSEKQDLGSLYAPFKPQKILRGQSAGAAKNVSLKVYYAAAYPSERFRFFNCPAFSHDRRISKMEVRGEAKPFDINIEKITSYPEKSQLIELAPSSFNAGNSLVGDYYLEIAAYNSDKKVIHGGFKRLPVYLSVIEEEREQVKSCAGEHPELQ